MQLFGRFIRSTTGKVAVGVLVGTLISVPATVWAVVSFTDVPPAHPFYSEITAVAEAGIAQGFNDGTYKPGNNVTRQAMAAFLERGVGRAVTDDGEDVVVNPGVSTEVAAVVMDAGATGAGTNGFVRVSGSVWATTFASTAIGCPCIVRVALYDRNDLLFRSFLQIPSLPDAADAIDSATVETVVPVDGDSTHMFRLLVEGIGTFDAGSVIASGNITATYYPLSGDGDSTDADGLTCTDDDGWEENDTSGSASAFSFTGSTNAIVCPTDQDWYSDSVAGGSEINIFMTFNNAEGNIDMCLWNMSTITLVDCSTTTGNSEGIDHSSALTETYAIRVFLVTDAGSVPGNTYTMKIT